ncbi:MauE/DoxX family redox-associated membrane protein [Streptomyces cupreus]|uniref:Methylamine utilisation protein MauE domain-containing protein n=1 Tax=Streptomyces cupreus TaxID=2759956 RepID=A0A7X1J9L8_9ACTN|nr:MauE/DoxX family redox-associated membrane protein [Streptomyces cupreus]MBC2906761.1 hypothetical protein [Streptomyces cupreus]
MRYLATGCQFLLGAVFVAAVFGKIRDRYAFFEFVGVIRELGLVRRSWARTTAVMAVAVEAVVPALLLAAVVPVGSLEAVSWWLRAGSAVLALGLLLAFTAGISLALRNGTQTSCACFGARGSVLGVRHIVRNVPLAVIASAGLLSHLMAGHVGGSPAGNVLAASAGVVLASVFVLFDDIAEIFVPARSTA